MERDEHEINIVNKTQTAGVFVIIVVCIFLFIANIAISALKGMDKAIINFDYFAIMFMFLSFVCFYSFSKFKNIYHLIIGIGFCLTFVCMLVLHFIYLMN